MILIKYGEIYTKSDPVRRQFERMLVRNIKVALPGAAVTRGRMRVFVDYDIKKAKPLLEKIFGIVSFSEIIEVPNDIEQIKKAALPLYTPGKTFRIDTSRPNKQFPLTSMDVSKQVGAYIVEKAGAKVNLSKPECTVYIEILHKNSLVYGNINPGPGGMPVGSAGDVACKYKGKSSLTAAWFLMKRGCSLVAVGAKQKFKPLESWHLGKKIWYAKSLPKGMPIVSEINDPKKVKKAKPGQIVFYPLISFERVPNVV